MDDIPFPQHGRDQPPVRGRTTADSDFVISRTVSVRLRDSTPVVLRPVVPGDKSTLSDGLVQMSYRSRYLRFMQPVPRLSRRTLAYLTELDYCDHCAWGACVPSGINMRGIGIGRYIRVAERPDTAEFALAVVDDYQGRGLGRALLFLLAESALLNGIGRFCASVHPENERMRRILAPAAVVLARRGPLISYELLLPLPEAVLSDPDLRLVLRRTAHGEMGGRPPASGSGSPPIAAS
jgi:GNAT superfamily N-acetyltransferase